MILVDVDRVCMSRPDRPLFSDVSVTVSSGDRLGVVGINGTGKTTLLSVIAGRQMPESGEVRRKKGVSVATLDQITELQARSVREAVGGGWQGEAALQRLGMGEKIDHPIETLSGGEQKRVALAQTVVAEADLLILDEPTNHLDVDAIEWLESALGAFTGGLVIVTHDRKVLDAVTTRILELERGSAYLHDGGYPGYLERTAAREQRAAAHESTRRNLARRELAWLRRGAKARTRKSKARITKANELIDGGPAPKGVREGDLNLASLHDGTPRLGDQVVELHDVTVGFDGEPPLITGLDLLLDRRERLGIVGANGSGKSTLLDVIAGRREPLAGRVIRGPTAVVGLHDQQGRSLDPNVTVRQFIAGEGAQPDWWDLALLERFWFDRDTQRSPISMLSGGERRRLQLVVTLAEKPNVLLLDEPTNDLDLDTLRSLEDFLEHWPGALIVISHDRALLNRTVDDVLVIDDRQARRWPGGYEGWLVDRRQPADKAAQDAPASSGASPSQKRGTAAGRNATTRSSATIRHELSKAEKELERLEALRIQLEAVLAESSTDHNKLAETGASLAECAEEHAVAEDLWLRLSDELEQR